MHWKDLKIKDEVHVVGRGLILVVNLKDNFLANEKSTETPTISVGDILTYKDKEYQIRGIEGFRNLFNGAASHLVGLLIKENI